MRGEARAGRGLGDERPVAGLGLVGPAFDRVEAGEEIAGREALRIGGERRLDGAAGLARLAGGETGADEAGEGLASRITSRIAARAGAAEGEGLEHRRCCLRLALAAETGGVEARRHCRCHRIRLCAQDPGDLPDAGPVLAGEVDASEHVEEFAVIRGRGAARR